MEPVSQSVVVRHWLREGRAAATAGRTAGPVVASGGDATLADLEPVDSLSDREALDALLSAKPGAASFLAREASIAWYRTTVDAGEFSALRLIESPEGLLWRALDSDRRPVAVARAIAAAPDVTAENSGVDVRRIAAIRRTLVDSGGPAPPLVVRTRRGSAPWTIVDGNHRAVARAFELLDSSAGFAPQPVYLGVRPNPVIRPIRERLGGVVRRLLGLEPTPVR